MSGGARLLLTSGVALLSAAAILVAVYFVVKTPDAIFSGPLLDAQKAVPATQKIAYHLKEQSSAASIGADLQKLGVIRSGKQFELLVSLMGVSGQLSAGDYELFKGSSTLTAIQSVTVKASVPTLKVTFPEGIRFEEMAELAEQAGFGTRQQFVGAVAAAKPPPEIAAALPEGASLQGYLFPDTYIMPVGSTAAQLVDLMLKTFLKRFTPELQAAAVAHGLALHQAVTMASIIEREAAIEADRPLIASVFYNRLKAGDLLGADPTTQFAVALRPENVRRFGYWKAQLTQEDLDTPSPYNTRKVAGLPPGPITNPGLASLEAVANPPATKLYYFVADAKKKDGSHAFAETEAQHLANVAAVGSP